MENQPVVTIEKWLTDGWKLYKQNKFTFFFASLLAAIISIPTLFFCGVPLYMGLYCMALKGMRGEDPKIRDIFKGFERYWGGFLLWLLFLGCTILLTLSHIGVVLTPLLWAMAMLAFPLLIDQKETVGTAFSTAFKTVFTWRNFWRFWLYGLALTVISGIGIIGFFFGIFITIPFAVCVHVIAYRDIFKPEEAFQAETIGLRQEYPFKLKAQYIGPISQIRELRDRIFEQVDNTNTTIKPLLEPSVEHIEGVFSKTADLLRRLQMIESYLQTTDTQRLQGEKSEVQAKLSTAPNVRIAMQYNDALKVVDERIANHKQLENLAAQIHAQLTTIRISLENTLVKIIRIKASPISNARFQTDDVSKELRSLQVDMDSLLDSMDEMENL